MKTSILIIFALLSGEVCCCTFKAAHESKAKKPSCCESASNETQPQQQNDCNCHQIKSNSTSTQPELTASFDFVYHLGEQLKFEKPISHAHQNQKLTNYSCNSPPPSSLSKVLLI
ncbi:MAG: hypothetical protein HY606_15660 [Planctomycetes bacterium]|nr:hypothetical protein [Planctomycetota bacterium]